MATGSSVSPGPGLATKARVPSRASAPRPDVDMLGMVEMFCGAGLVVALLLATYGLDMSIEFF
jgi:hypothetical protein